MMTHKFIGTFFAFLLLSFVQLYAQDKEAKITLSFVKADSLNICKAHVTSNDSAVKEVEVKLFVQRMFSLLPVGDATATDEDGTASFEFPADIPADKNGKLTVIAKIEDDENYANTDTKADVDWGVVKAESKSQKVQRSLSASRENAPIYFIVVSNLIIIGIWGTLLYVILQVFKIKRISKHLTNK